MSARKPAAFRLDPQPQARQDKPETADQDPQPESPKRPQKTATAGRRPRAMPAPEVTMDPEPGHDALVPRKEPVQRAARTIRWLSLFASSAALLFTLWAGLAVTGLIENLFARSPALGYAGLVLLGVAGVSLAALTLRELFGLLRLHKLETIQRDAARAASSDDKAAASRVTAALVRLYSGRADTAWGLSRLKDSLRDIIDPADRIRLIERDLMAGVDEDAGRIIARTARRVALVTAVTPVAALDILLVALENLKMLRAIATAYGGRPGTFGTLKLARMVIGHLAVTGGLALTDNLIQHVIGKGLIGRLSSRFGEGAVNGILTARIGLAALDLCRPLPFLTRNKPALADFMREIISFDTGKD